MIKYVVNENWHDEYGDDGHDTHIFTTRKKAEEFYKKEIEENKDFLTGDNIITNKTTDSYEMYEDGYYLMNHYCIYIKEIKEDEA